MKRTFKIINVIVAIVFFVSAMAVDTSDVAIKVCFISAGYLFLYTFRRDIMRAVFKVFEFSVEALKESISK